MRVPFADQGLNKIPDGVTDRQALLVGDVLATGYWAARISDITREDTVLVIGAGPTGLCTLLCVMLKRPKRIVVCEKDENRIRFIHAHYPGVLTVSPEEYADFVRANSDHGGADVVLLPEIPYDIKQVARTSCWRSRGRNRRSAWRGNAPAPTRL